MVMDQKITDTFLRLFDGNQDRHLVLSGKPKKNDKGKIETKARLDDGPLTTEMVRAHIEGDMSIGVSPVRSDSKCLFGVLDIDWYDMPEDDVVRVAERLRTPCAAFRTKSRGLHVYVFTTEPVPARHMHDYLVVLRKRLGKKIAAETEMFPKATQTVVNPGDKPTSVNLPLRGQQRELAFLIDGDGFKKAIDDKEPAGILSHIDENCRIDGQAMRDIADAQPTLDTSDIGYKVPDNPAGRNDLLLRVAASMQVRGWPDSELEAEIRRLNGDAKFHHLFAVGPLTESEIVNILKRTKRLDKGTPTPLHYRQIEKFNRNWAVMAVNGQVEFLNVEENQCYAKNAFLDMTAPQTVQIGKNRFPVAKLWLADPDRSEYRGIVIESPDYKGPGFNVFQGWTCAREQGDASLWVEYIEDVLCSGDKALAKWVMTYLADAVQRPWSLHPGSALALRGGQGAGKSFLGRAMRKLVGRPHAQAIAESSRMFAQFNRGLFGSTFVLCEESLFAGSARQANIAKAFITQDTWSYEQKYLAQFDGKNVHRIIATTNEDQAVHIDHDDRRWTVIDVPTRFDDHGAEARAWWQPYYDLVDDHPGIILDYLMSYQVDRGLIQYGYVTEAKASDKIASDPLLALMDEIAISGMCPDDLAGRGRISAATLARECYVRGANRHESSRRFSNQVRNKFGGKSVPNCHNVERVHAASDSSGILVVTPIYRTDRSGVELPPLSEFRKLVSRITGQVYPDDGEWQSFVVAGPGFDSDPNGGDAEAVEQQAKSQQRWVKDDDIPF